MRNDSGFTLLETMIVILIVGILSSIAMATYAGVQNMGYDTEAKTNLHYAITAAKAYYSGHDSTYDGLDASTLADETAGITFKDGSSPASPGAIYVFGAGSNEFHLKCLSMSGRVFSATADRLSVTIDF